jgi:hypothetical protein
MRGLIVPGHRAEVEDQVALDDDLGLRAGDLGDRDLRVLGIRQVLDDEGRPRGQEDHGSDQDHPP